MNHGLGFYDPAPIPDRELKCEVGGCAHERPCPWHRNDLPPEPVPVPVVVGGAYGDQEQFSDDLEDWTLDDPKLGGTPERSRQIHEHGEQAWQKRFGRKRAVYENLIVREAGQPRWCLRERMRKYAKPWNFDIFIEIDMTARTALWHGWERHEIVLDWPRKEIGSLWLVRGVMQPMSAYPVDSVEGER